MLGAEADLDWSGTIQFRIGINVGDVIIEGDDILGSGVNIAARIEGIATLAESRFPRMRGGRFKVKSRPTLSMPASRA